MDFFQPQQQQNQPQAATASSASQQRQFQGYSQQQNPSNMYFNAQQAQQQPQQQQNHHFFPIQSANSPLEHGGQHSSYAAHSNSQQQQQQQQVHNNSSYQSIQAYGHQTPMAAGQTAFGSSNSNSNNHSNNNSYQRRGPVMGQQQHGSNQFNMHMAQAHPHQQHGHYMPPNFGGMMPPCMNPMMMAGMNPPMEAPLRIVIDSKFVGAIIGQGGQQIRQISQESKAKVIVDTNKTGKENYNTEKLINIVGNAECTSKAVVKILEIIQRESTKDDEQSTPEVVLKIRVPYQLVGRLIGKRGATIKQIMKSTETVISVLTTSNDVPLMNDPYKVIDMSQSERSIVVKGPTIETVSCAEAKISEKLRKCYMFDANVRLREIQKDMQNSMMNPGLMQHMTAAMPFGGGFMSRAAAEKRTVRMWIPDNMVGVIIGAKGKNIKSLIRETSADIKIEAEKKKEEDGAGDGPDKVEKKDEERMITISGNQAQVTRAQMHIFSKLADQMSQAIDELKLRTEMTVPSKIVGRIIGRGGQNVRELQRITGAMVKIPEEDKQQQSGEPEVNREGIEDGMTVVRIIGAMHPSQNVQFRLSELVYDYMAANESSVSKKNNGTESNTAV